jgi:hypothetical protein
MTSGRTVSGARAFAKVLGFEDFLGRVEKDRIERLEKTPELFEKYLPYAMALRVEKKWVQAFSGIGLPPPEWFQGVGGGSSFQPSLFINDLNILSSHAGSAMTSSTRSSFGSSSSGASSGSGFSDGGSSGGGLAAAVVAGSETSSLLSSVNIGWLEVNYDLSTIVHHRRQRRIVDLNRVLRFGSFIRPLATQVDGCGKLGACPHVEQTKIPSHDACSFC